MYKFFSGQQISIIDWLQDFFTGSGFRVLITQTHPRCLSPALDNSPEQKYIHPIHPTNRQRKPIANRIKSAAMKLSLLPCLLVGYLASFAMGLSSSPRVPLMTPMQQHQPGSRSSSPRVALALSSSSSGTQTTEIPLVISGTNIELTPALVEYVKKRVGGNLNKLGSNGAIRECDVHLSVNKNPKVRHVTSK